MDILESSHYGDVAGWGNMMCRLASAGQVEMEDEPGGDTFEENRERILKEVMEDTGMPRFLLTYHDDHLEYEVEVAVPTARTHKCRRLREEHQLN